MHVGRSYGVSSFIYWTRYKTYILAAISLLVVTGYQSGCRWISLPWPVLALLGTAASFIVGFKNVQTYNRTLEAQQILSSIACISRYWGLIARDFPLNLDISRSLVYRHLAWLTALRYQLRTERVWEAATHRHNFEYRHKLYTVPEHEIPLADALRAYLPPEQLPPLLGSGNTVIALASAQSSAIRELYSAEKIPVLHYTEMQKTLKELLDQHSRAERIKNFPYPRQYAIVDAIFVWTFAVLLPFGTVEVFGQLSHGGPTAWLAVPFSVLIAWMYVSLDQVGESTENPFEGGANDVPITHVFRLLEAELRKMLGERDVASPSATASDIIM